MWFISKVIKTMWLSQIWIATALSFTTHHNIDSVLKFVKKKVDRQEPFSEVTGEKLAKIIHNLFFFFWIQKP